MAPERYVEFKADIQKNGLIQPILIHKGQILDGRHRQRACDELGIDPEYLTDDDLTEVGGDPWAYVWSAMMRKNHTESQLSMFAAEHQKRLKPAAMERQKAGGQSAGRGRAKKVHETFPEPNQQSRDQAGKKFGITGRTVSKAAAVIEKGCKQIKQAVKDGRVNVSLAEKIVKKFDGDQQQEVVAVAMVCEKPESALREAVKPEPKPFNSDSEGDRLIDALRKTLDQWPEKIRPKAINLIRCVLREYTP